MTTQARARSVLGDTTLQRGWRRVAYIATRAILQRVVVFPAVNAACRPQVFGASAPEGLDRPLVIVANHVSHLDCPLLLRVFPARLRRRTTVVAAADYFYRTRLRAAAVTLALGTMPFERTGNVAAGLESCTSVLASGGSLLIFPEGTRSRDGQIGSFKRGAARLSISTGTPVLPVGIRGLHAVLPAGARVPHPHIVEVHVGSLLWPLPGEDATELTARMAAAVRQLSESTAVEQAFEPLQAARAH